MPTRLVLVLLLVLPAARAGDGEVRLLTDDAIPRYLHRGQELAKAEQWDRMVDVLQRVIAGDPEIFPDLKREVLHAAVHSRDGILYYPARELCIEELAKLPPEGLLAYRAAYDPAARDLFDRAAGIVRLDQRLTAFAEVYDLYLVSSVGDDALEQAADLNLALGRYYEALSLLRRLLDVYPRDTDRDLAMARAKAAYCAARIGAGEVRDIQLHRLASEYPRARILIEGKGVPVAELPDHAAMRVRGTDSGDSDRGWPLAGGNAARSRVGDDLPEELPRTPFWTFRLSERDARIEARWDRWQVAMHDREEVQPRLEDDDLHNDLVRPYPAVRPVVHDGLVFYKDGIAYLGRAVGSGTLSNHRRDYYTFPERKDGDATFLIPSGECRPGTGPDGKAARARETVYRFLHYGLGSVAVDGDYVACVEASQQFPPEHLRPMGDSQGRVPATAHPNTLNVYDRRTGKTHWVKDQYGDLYPNNEDVLEEWKREHELFPEPTFRGPGVAQGGLLYTIVESGEQRSVGLWCLDLETAHVLFRTHLHFPDEILHKYVLPEGSSLAVAGGVVYAATGAGVVAAVDALPPGRVRWIRRYPRNLTQGGNRRGPGALLQGFAYGDPVVVGGKVILAPVDAALLLALDAESGQLAWSLPLRDIGDVHYMVGVSDGVIVMAGSEVAGIDLARGKLLWRSKQRLPHWPFGRGFVGKRYAYVPTYIPGGGKSFIHCFEIHGDGSEARRHEFDVPRLGNLVSVGGRLIAASDERICCFTTYQAEIDRIGARMNREGESAPLLVERARIALHAGPDRERARADLRRAIELAEPGGETDAEARIRAVDNLIAMAVEAGDVTLLDEAREIARDMKLKDDPRTDRRHPYLAQLALVELDIYGRTGRYPEAVEAIERFLERFADAEVVVGSKVVGVAEAVRELRKRLDSHAEFRDAFVARVRRAIREAAGKGDAGALEAIPARFGMQPPVEESYLALADLHEKAGHGAEAELALRRLIRTGDFESRPVRAEAHLRLARLLAERGYVAEARVERDDGVSRLDEEGRRLHAGLIESIDRMLVGERPPPRLVQLELPLAAHAMELEGAAPVPLGGDVPDALADFVLAAGPDGYAGYDGSGKRLWQQPHPAGAGISLGPPDDPRTAVLAAAVAAARFTRVIGEDLIIGDVFGVTRVHALTGEIRWQRPRPSANADRALECIEDLRGDLERVRNGQLNRLGRLPSHARAGEIIVRVHPRAGIEAYKAATGDLVWADYDVKRETVGEPDVVGQLLVVGWAQPARVHVYDVGTGQQINQYEGRSRDDAKKPAVLLAPPVLDPLGRVFVVTGTDEKASAGSLDILSARSDEPAHRRSIPVHGRYPAVLHADGRLAVFHDGGSGGENLHFLDLAKDEVTAIAAEDILRDVHLLRDGGRLFVFTHGSGDRALGARLFRVDLLSRSTLSYARPPMVDAYAVPVLTQRYVAVAGSDARTARVRLYERETSKEMCPPSPVFAVPGGGGLAADRTFGPDAGTRYDRPPALATTAKSLSVGHPFGTSRLYAGE